MVKISDVARDAGVSVATVSRALNGHETVNPELAARVRESAERLGYRPNAIARGLRRQRTDVIALIISDVSNPFFTAIARGVEDVAQRHGYSVILCNADEDPEKEARYLDVAEVEQVAGVILSPHSATTDISRLQAASIPLVLVDRPVAGDLDTVVVDSVHGARVATAHLLDEGWIRPACVTGPDDASTALDRLEGYRAAISGRSGELFEHSPFTIEGGRSSASRLLDRRDPPDAYFVANASLALGVLAELRDRGIRVGIDVGLVAFDDAPWAPFISPPISVVAQPAYDIGRRAAEMLMSRVSRTDDESSRHLVLDTTLVVRESSKRAPGSVGG